jgi:dCMP deaminase
MSKWNKRWMDLAHFVAEWSGDTSTKVGAVIVDEENNLISLGWNDLCRGIKDTPERRTRPEKYKWTEHAERNAVYNVAGRSGRVGYCVIYSTLFPCTDCARGIIQATNLDIRQIVVPPTDLEQPNRDFMDSYAMLTETGRTIKFYE